jgi:DNA-binding MarR family transcriptional regulator
MSFSFKRPEDSPGFLLWQLTNQWQQQQRKALAKLKLTHAQFVVLAGLLWLSTHTEEDITQSQLAELTQIDKMMVSDLMVTLMQKKLLQRSRHSTDSRAYALSLTAKGRKLVLKAIPVVEGIDIQFFSSKAATLVQFKRVLDKLAKA